MLSGLRSLRHHNKLALLLICASAFLLRAFVPVGWMPMVSDHGLGFAVCDGFGPDAAMAAMGMPMSPDAEHQKHHDKKPDQPCPFAGLALAFDDGAAPPIVLTPLPQAIVPLALPTLIEIAERRLAALLPPQTGPPASHPH